MNPALAGIQNNALLHSRRAVKLWMESAAVAAASAERPPLCLEVVRIVTELNALAADECRQAVHSMEFIRRYEANA